MINERLPLELEAGAKAYPMFSTEIINLDGGGEVRNRRWRYPKIRFQFNLSPSERDNEDFIAFRDHYYAVGGPHESFPFTHWSDYHGVGEAVEFLSGSNTQAQLMRNYTRGAVTQKRPIYLPINGTVAIYQNGVAMGIGWSVDYLTGIVTFSGSQAGNTITADFEFDVPVRFMDDEIELVGLTNVLEQPLSIQLIEVRDQDEDA